MNRELAKIVDEIGKEKGISRELLAAAVQEAIAAAVTKRIGKYLEPDIEVDLDRGIITIEIPKEVVEEVDNRWFEILIDDAQELKPGCQLGDVIMVPSQLEDLGRQAALVAKQRLFEKIRDAEKSSIRDEFAGKVGEIINGTVLKMDRDNLIVNIGKAEAIMPRREMIQGEFFSRGDYVRALLLDIKEHSKGLPQLILSRTHPKFLRKLFEAEIPEVFEGLIDVKNVAREPGDRAKVAVYSKSSSIDPVGACIGMKGARINSISNELRGERIDVIEWSPDPVRYVCNAISPAQVLLTNIFEDEKTLEIIVPDDQLSLAIGRRGQNVKLAAMLTEWRLDVLKESEYVDIRKERMQEQEQELRDFYEMYNLENLEILDSAKINALRENGIDDIEKLSNATVDEVIAALSLTEEEAVSIINAAIDYYASRLGDEEEMMDEDADGQDEE